MGLANFTSLLTSSVYHRSVALTLLFEVVVVVGTLTVGLLITFVIYEVTDRKAASLLAAMWPYALPAVVAGIVFLAHPSVGVYTHYLDELLGVELDWFTNGAQAITVVAIATIWKQLGFNIIFSLAALNNVPATLTEAATLDGVGRWQLFTRVYVPLISPTLVFPVVLNTIYAFFGSFAFIDLMTQGGPTNATNFLICKLFHDAFQFDNLGIASAESVILFVIVAGLTYVQLRVSDRYTHY